MHKLINNKAKKNINFILNCKEKRQSRVPTLVLPTPSGTFLRHHEVKKFWKTSGVCESSILSQRLRPTPYGFLRCGQRDATSPIRAAVTEPVGSHRNLSEVFGPFELNMPEVLTVSEFVEETSEDYKAPTTSDFSTRMIHCRNTVTVLEEVTHTPPHTSVRPSVDHRQVSDRSVQTFVGLFCK